MNFSDQVIHVKEGVYDFPDHFENEIFYSTVTKPLNKLISYKSSFSIKYILAGEESYFVNGNLKKVKAGKMLIVNDQADVTNAADISEAFSIFISENILEDCRRNLLSRHEQLLDAPLDNLNMTVNFYDDVCDQNIPAVARLMMRMSQFPHLFIPIDYFYELASDLLISQNNLYHTINRLQKRNLSTRKEIYRRVTIGIDYLNDHLDSKFDLDKLARVCCMSKFHLIRCFRQIYHTTPHRYFTLRKIERAKKMLCAKRAHSITEVAFELGYPDIASFSKQFKQITKSRPGDFKEEMRRKK